MGRLIDADALIEILCGVNNEIVKGVIGTIQTQPTAYDVEKVVAELEEKRKEIQRCMNIFGPTVDLVAMDGAFISAIEIVRKGGV